MPSAVCRILLAIGLASAASASFAGSRYTVQHDLLGSVPGAPKPSVTASGNTQVFVELFGAPAAVSYGNALRAATSGLSTADAVAAGLSQIEANVSEQASFMASLAGSGIAYTEIFRVQKAMNGIALIVPRSQLGALRALPGVQAVRTLVPKKPMSNHSTTFIGANSVWQGLPGGIQADGTGIKIGVIDTGIDYQHANFGGAGLLADYQKNDRVTLNNITFPTAKVAGGTDLAGENYDASGNNGSTTPTPDPNPMDCAGHGSHVAGSAAGFGVKSDGTTFNGPYDTATINTLRIQPGVATKAKLYAIKVFGCGETSTNLVIQAIDYALDPTNSGNMSNHLDIVNLSLGSDIGFPAEDPEVDAMNNAALVGMIPVIAAGNAGDTTFVLGTPGVAPRAVTAAAIWDGGELAGNLNVTTPPAIAGNYFAVPAAFGGAVPQVPLSQQLVYALPHNGCSAFTNAAAMAGKFAVIDRGACNFDGKVLNAQTAGAVGAIVVDNRPEVPITMGVGTPSISAMITIPSVMISQADGQAIEAQLGGTVQAALSSVPGGDLLASFSSRGPTNGGPLSMKPDLAAPGVNVVSTQTGFDCSNATTCTLVPNNQPLTLSGTSMATPHIAGTMALLRELHPTWTVEELKALAMNGALHDVTTAPGGAGTRYDASRVGVGRVDTVNSAELGVIAFNADGSGNVGVTFPGEIVGSTQATRMVHVVNREGVTAVLSAFVDTVLDNPGVSFSLPAGPTLIIPPGGSIDIPVQMNGTANLVKHMRDPTMFASQATAAAGTVPRFWISEETANLVILQGGVPKVRVPLYVAPYGAATMSGGGVVPTGGASSGTFDIPLSGGGLCTGAIVPGPTCAGSLPNDVESLVTPFELQAINPRDPSVPAESDVHHVGIAVDPINDLINFGISTHGSGTLPANFVNITILDLANPPHPLFTLFTTGLADPSGNPTDVWVTGIFDWNKNTTSFYTLFNLLDSTQPDTRVFNNNVGFLSIPNAFLHLPSTFQYVVDTFTPPFFDFAYELGPFVYHQNAQGLDFGGAFLLDDLPGATIPVKFNNANFKANGSLGALLLHHHNQNATSAEVLTIPPVPQRMLTVAKAGSGTGTVTSNIGGINCGATCTTTQDDGTTIVLTATAGANSGFSGWSGGGCSGTGTCTIALTADTTVTATFTVGFTLTVTKSGIGTVTSDVGGINCGATCAAVYTGGTVVTLTAVAGAGQSFTGWSGGGCSGTGTCVVTMNASTTVNAAFTGGTAPDTTITGFPPNPSISTTAVFTFTSTVPGSTFLCSLDGSSFTVCTSPDTLTVGNGTHTFQVAAKDAQGNVDPTPASYTWTVIASGPVTPVDIPTLSEWMLLLLATLLFGVGAMALRDRRR